MDIDFSKCSLYQLLDYIHETERVGNVEIIKIVKERTDNFNPELLKFLCIDVQAYLYEKIHELEEEFTEEEITNAIEERKRQGIQIPYREHPPFWEIMTDKEKADFKNEYKEYPYKKRLDLEELLFPYQFSKIHFFIDIAVEKRKNQNYVKDKHPQNIKPLQWKGTAIQLTELTEALINCNMLNPELNKEQIYERIKQLFNFDFDHKEHKKTIRKRTKDLTPFIEILDTSVKNWITQKDGN